jgi:PAS domain S-box-containing protein
MRKRGSLEELLARTEQLGHMGSWEWQPGDDHMVWSDNLYRIFGLEPGEIEPTLDFFFDHVHPSDRDRVEAKTERWRREDAVDDTLQFRFVRPDGDLRHLRAITAGVERGTERRVTGLVVDRTDQSRAEREIAAHVAVAEALADWRSLEVSGPQLVGGLATALQLDRGALWVPEGGTLRAKTVWQAPGAESEALAAELRELRLPRGTGVAGEAWETRRPVVDRRGALAIPAVSGSRALAILELAGRETLEPTDRLLDSLVGIGGEIGAFLERRRGELEPPVLTRREIEILQLVADGQTGPEIAPELGIAPTTVKTHFQNIYAKLDTADRAAAIAEAMRLGLIR